MKKILYVCGFAFNFADEKVVLIKKERPDWQKGKYNGVGGKINEGEDCYKAMRREFQEETGHDCWGWQLFCTYEGDDYIVYFMTTHTDIERVKTLTDEEIIKPYISDVHKLPHIPNLKWLIPLALDKSVKHSTVKEH